MYEIQVDKSQNLITLRIAGFLDPDEVSQIAKDEQEAVRALTNANGAYSVLVEASDSAIQSQAVVTAFQSFIANSPRKASRIAIVIDGSLARGQARRIAEGSQAEVFSTVLEAKAWLLKSRSPTRRF